MAKRGTRSPRQKECGGAAKRVADERVTARESNCGVPTDKEKLRGMRMERQDSRHRAAVNHSGGRGGLQPRGDLQGTGTARRDDQPKRETAGTIRVPAVSVQILVE